MTRQLGRLQLFAVLMVLVLLGPRAGSASGGEELQPTALAAHGANRLVPLEGEPILLPEGLLLTGVNGQGGRVLHLPEVPGEVASLFAQDCPTGDSLSVCIGEERVITQEVHEELAGLKVSHLWAEYRPAADSANSTWEEYHSILQLPSGRRIDLVGQVLRGSGYEEALQQAHKALLAGLGRRTD